MIGLDKSIVENGERAIDCRMDSTGPASDCPEILFPYGDGEMAVRVREFDWSITAIGSIAAWPQSLRTAVAVMMDSLLPQVMLWGAEGGHDL